MLVADHGGADQVHATGVLDHQEDVSIGAVDDHLNCEAVAVIEIARADRRVRVRSIPIRGRRFDSSLESIRDTQQRSLARHLVVGIPQPQGEDI